MASSLSTFEVIWMPLVSASAFAVVLTAWRLGHGAMAFKVALWTNCGSWLAPILVMKATQLNEIATGAEALWPSMSFLIAIFCIESAMVLLTIVLPRAFPRRPAPDD